jgi:hypothetical protein
MKESYCLNTDSLPTIPVPHDCRIKCIRIENQSIVFIFEDDISWHDSIVAINPKAKSLVIRYHLVNDVRDYELYKWVKPNLLFREGGYKSIAHCLKKGQHEILKGLTHSELTYLFHYVGYNTIVIELYSESARQIVLKGDVDAVEYEWIY